MVDEHDAEKPVADLQRSFELADHQNHDADLPPAQTPQPQPASAAPETGDGSPTLAHKWYRYDGSLRDILCVFGAVCVLSWQAYIVYEYSVGTRTTATVDHCNVTRGNWYTWVSLSSCRATWNVGGQSQTGTIEPPFEAAFWSSVGPKNGSSLDVHVHDGTAVTLSKTFYFLLACCAFFLVVFSPRLWKAWRGRNRG